MKFLFVVVKRETSHYWAHDGAEVGAGGNFFSSYTYEPGSEPYDLNYIASRIVAAEKCLTHAETEICRVLCFDHEEGKVFDAFTRCRVLFSRAGFRDIFAGIGCGLRQMGHYDRFVTVNIGRNRTRGRVTKHFLGGAVRRYDIHYGANAGRTSKSTKTRPGSELERIWAPLYIELLEAVPGLDAGAELDRFGNLKPRAPVVGKRNFSGISNLAAARGAAMRERKSSYMCDDLLEVSLRSAEYALKIYEMEMNRFDHRWGNGKTPALLQQCEYMAGAASVWFPIALALGYQIPERHGLRLERFFTLDGQPVSLLPDSAKVTQAPEVVLSCIQRLYTLHTYFIEKILPAMPFPFVSGHNNDGPLYDLEHARAIYDLMPDLTNAFFDVASTLGVLQSVLIMRDKGTRPAGLPTKRIAISFQPTPYIEPEQFPTLVHEPYLEVIPRDRDPFITITEPAEVSVTLPFVLPTTTTTGMDLPEDFIDEFDLLLNRWRMLDEGLKLEYPIWDAARVWLFAFGKAYEQIDPLKQPIDQQYTP